MAFKKKLWEIRRYQIDFTDLLASSGGVLLEKIMSLIEIDIFQGQLSETVNVDVSNLNTVALQEIRSDSVKTNQYPATGINSATLHLDYGDLTPVAGLKIDSGVTADGVRASVTLTRGGVAGQYTIRARVKVQAWDVTNGFDPNDEGQELELSETIILE